MFTKEMNKLADVLIEKEISKGEDKDLIVYGLSTGIELCFNIITTIVLGFLFEMVFESLVFLLSFSLIRTYAGGYHCQKAINCYLLSSGIVALVLPIVKFTPKEFIPVVGVIILIISIPILIKLAPVETPTKPLDEEEKKYYRKKRIFHLVVMCLIITLLFFWSLNTIILTICLGNLVAALFVIKAQWA